MHLQRPDFHIRNHHQSQTCTPDKRTLYTSCCQMPTTYLGSVVSKSYNIYAHRTQPWRVSSLPFLYKAVKTRRKKAYCAKKRTFLSTTDIQNTLQVKRGVTSGRTLKRKWIFMYPAGLSTDLKKNPKHQIWWKSVRRFMSISDTSFVRKVLRLSQ
jgi:hypothetical protein